MLFQNQIAQVQFLNVSEKKSYTEPLTVLSGSYGFGFGVEIYNSVLHKPFSKLKNLNYPKNP